MKITLSTQCLCGGKFTKFMVEDFYQLVRFCIPYHHSMECSQENMATR